VRRCFSQLLVMLLHKQCSLNQFPHHCNGNSRFTVTIVTSNHCCVTLSGSGYRFAIAWYLSDEHTVILVSNQWHCHKHCYSCSWVVSPCWRQWYFLVTLHMPLHLWITVEPLVCMVPLPRNWNYRSGQPHHTWLWTVESDLAPLDISLAVTYRWAHSRQAWNMLVEMATSISRQGIRWWWWWYWWSMRLTPELLFQNKWKGRKPMSRFTCHRKLLKQSRKMRLLCIWMYMLVSY